MTTKDSVKDTKTMSMAHAQNDIFISPLKESIGFQLVQTTIIAFDLDIFHIKDFFIEI